VARLADVVSASGLSGYAVIALLLFFLAFVLTLAAVFSPVAREEHASAAQLPFDEGTTGADRGGSQ
jgi:cbb3-type cytochrome oxidase subunit 3